MNTESSKVKLTPALIVIKINIWIALAFVSGALFILTGGYHLWRPFKTEVEYKIGEIQSFSFDVRFEQPRYVSLKLPQEALRHAEIRSYLMFGNKNFPIECQVYHNGELVSSAHHGAFGHDSFTCARFHGKSGQKYEIAFVITAANNILASYPLAIESIVHPSFYKDKMFQGIIVMLASLPFFLIAIVLSIFCKLQ